MKVYRPPPGVYHLSRPVYLSTCPRNPRNFPRPSPVRLAPAAPACPHLPRYHPDYHPTASLARAGLACDLPRSTCPMTTRPPPQPPLTPGTIPGHNPPELIPAINPPAQSPGYQSPARSRLPVPARGSGKGESERKARQENPRPPDHHGPRPDHLTTTTTTTTDDPPHDHHDHHDKGKA